MLSSLLILLSRNLIDINTFMKKTCISIVKLYVPVGSSHLAVL